MSPQDMLFAAMHFPSTFHTTIKTHVSRRRRAQRLRANLRKDLANNANDDLRCQQQWERWCTVHSAPGSHGQGSQQDAAGTYLAATAGESMASRQTSRVESTVTGHLANALYPIVSAPERLPVYAQYPPNLPPPVPAGSLVTLPAGTSTPGEDYASRTPQFEHFTRALAEREFGQGEVEVEEETDSAIVAVDVRRSDEARHTANVAFLEKELRKEVLKNWGITVNNGRTAFLEKELARELEELKAARFGGIVQQDPGSTSKFKPIKLKKLQPAESHKTIIERWRLDVAVRGVAPREDKLSTIEERVNNATQTFTGHEPEQQRVEVPLNQKPQLRDKHTLSPIPCSTSENIAGDGPNGKTELQPRSTSLHVRWAQSKALAPANAATQQAEEALDMVHFTASTPTIATSHSVALKSAGSTTSPFQSQQDSSSASVSCSEDAAPTHSSFPRTPRSSSLPQNRTILGINGLTSEAPSPAQAIEVPSLEVSMRDDDAKGSTSKTSASVSSLNAESFEMRAQLDGPVSFEFEDVSEIRSYTSSPVLETAAVSSGSICRPEPRLLCPSSLVSGSCREAEDFTNSEDLYAMSSCSDFSGGLEELERFAGGRFSTIMPPSKISPNVPRHPAKALAVPGLGYSMK